MADLRNAIQKRAAEVAEAGCRFVMYASSTSRLPQRCGRATVEGEDFCMRHVSTEEADIWRSQVKSWGKTAAEVVAATKAFTLVGPLGSGGWDLHIKGCGDLSQPKYRRFQEQFYDLHADNAADAVDQWIDDEMQEMGYTARDVKVLDCAKKGIPKEAPAPKVLDPSLCPGSGQPFPPDARINWNLAYPHGPCPVCHQSFGAKGGRVPRHKKLAEWFYGERSKGADGRYLDKYEKHLTKNRRGDDALCDGGPVEYVKPVKDGKLVRGMCADCVAIYERETKA